MIQKLNTMFLQQYIFIDRHKKECLTLFATFVCVLMVLLPEVAFATDANNAIQQGVDTGAQHLWKILATIVVPIGGCLLAWNVFKAIFGGERGMESAKQNILIIVLVIIIVFAAPKIVNMIAGWFTASAQWQTFQGIK